MHCEGQPLRTNDGPDTHLLGRQTPFCRCFLSQNAVFTLDHTSRYRWLKWPFIVLSGLTILVSAQQLPRADISVPVLFLALITINIASLVSIRLPLLRSRISLPEILCTLAILLFGVKAAVLLSALVSLCTLLRCRGKIHEVLPDIAAIPISTYCIAWLLRLTVGPVNAYGSSPVKALLVIFMIWAVRAAISGAFDALGFYEHSTPPTWRSLGDSFLWSLPAILMAAAFSVVIANLVLVAGFYPTIGTITVIGLLYSIYFLSAQSKKAEASVATLRDGVELFQVAFDYAAIGMALVSPTGRWLRVNRSLCHLLGYAESELKSRHFQSLVHPDEAATAIANINKLLKDNLPTFQAENRYVHKDGHVVTVLWSVSQARVEESDCVHLIFQIQDITDRKLAEEQLLHDALHDTLTGLPNRALLIDHLKLTLARAKRNKNQKFAVLFLDLDRFKIVNDSLGHIVGDQLLIGIARRLEKCLRTGDTVARVGGDEFTILLDDLTDQSEAIAVAERIQQEISVPFFLGGREVFTTVSIGIAPSSRGYTQPDEILRDADTAMYRAKASGKARHEIFDEEMHALALNLLQMETDLRWAHERDEFVIEYQPIVSLTDFHLCGFEALLRWQHPQRGLISPLDFIPIAEEGGQILMIGQWVLQKACEDMSNWQKKFPTETPIYVTVNLSAKQFAQADLIDQIKDSLNRSGLDPNCLKLEITESVVMDNIENATAMLRQLRALGVRLSIDDFGTGYSSLSYLHRFPIDTLKIDRSFVTRIVNDKENIEIVRTILMLAENLGMDVVAEGVETQEQMALLRQLSCHSGQGYFFSRPVNAQTAEQIIKDTYVPPQALVA